MRERLSQIQRKAIWLAYKKKCFYCDKIISKFRELNIEHILPYNLKDKKQFEEIKKAYELDFDFSIHSYFNCVPSCVSCNSKKRSQIFPPKSILFYLNLAKQKVPLIEKYEKKIERDIVGFDTLSSMKILVEDNFLTEDQVYDLFEIFNQYKEIINNPLVVCFGVNLEVEFLPQLPEEKMNLPYAIVCDKLFDNLTNLLKTELDCLFTFCEDSRPGDCYSVRIAFWGIGIEKLKNVLNKINGNWEILEISNFNTVYEEDAVEYFRVLAKTSRKEI